MKWVHRRCSEGVKGSLQPTDSECSIHMKWVHRGVVGEGQATGRECSIHMKWVHRRCSGVKGSLQAESAAFI